MKGNVQVGIKVDYVTINGLPVQEVIYDFADLAHQLLIELSTYRQRNNIDEPFECECYANELLNKIED